jgi:hypothetical protein
VKIFKYELPNPLPYSHAVAEVELPEGAWILKINDHNGSIQLWALVDPTAEKESRRFLVQGTGHEITAVDSIEDLLYMDTAKVNGFVWHVFEIAPVDL